MSKYLFTSEEYENAMDRMNQIRNEQRRIEQDINYLESILSKKILDEYLLSLQLKSPTIIETGQQIGDYRYIFERIIIENIVLYPLWLSLNCNYPAWSKDIRSLNIEQLSPLSSNRDLEILSSALSEILSCSYETSSELIKNNKIQLPYLCISELDGSNVKIDFANPDNDENGNDEGNDPAENDQVENIVSVKFILVLPKDYVDSLIEFI